MRRARALGLLLAAGAAGALAATDLLPARIAEFAREVESVRGRRFERPVPAAEIDAKELKATLRAKLTESLPATPEETRRTLVAIGLIDDTPDLERKLLDFYSSQVIAFYDTETRRFYVVKGADSNLRDEGEGLDGMAEKLIFSHELTHALQDQSLNLDPKLKALKDDGDRALALQCLLEGEATLVMVKVALADLPGADASVEEALAPLLSAGTLEKANVPKDVPDYFIEQLFFPYVEGTAYVRRAVKKGGWAEVDRLWKAPPVSTAQILHDGASPPPEKDLLPQGLDGLAPGGYHPLYSDTMGEWGIRFLLRRGLDRPEADAAAAGWRGDRVAFFSSQTAGAIAYLWRVRMENAAAAERFEKALRKERKSKPTPQPEQTSRQGRDVLVAAGFKNIPSLALRDASTGRRVASRSIGSSAR